MLKNRITYGAALLASVVFVFLYPQPITLVVFYCLLILAGFSFLAALYSANKISIIQSFNKPSFIKGEMAVYQLSLSNKSRLMFIPLIRLFYEGEDNPAIDFESFSLFSASLYPGETKGLNSELSCIFRGNYSFGLSKIQVFDCLGVFKFNRPVKQRLNLRILPLVREITDFPFSKAHLTDAASAFDIMDEDVSMISDIKKYEPSDGFKKIHWKLSAKKNELLVKQFQSSALNTSVFIVDTNSDKKGIDQLAYEDAICEELITDINYLLLKKHPCKLCYSEHGEFISKENGINFSEFYQAVSDLEFSGCEFRTVIDSSVFFLKNTANIFIYSQALDRELCEIFRNIKRLGHNVVFIYFSKQNNSLYDELINNGIICIKRHS